MLNPGLTIVKNGETLTMVFLDYRFAYCDAACGIDETRDTIMQQVEECAKKLKREDIQRVALVRLALSDRDEHLISNIHRWFEEEDIDVVCLYANRLTDAQYNFLEPQFEYGIVNDWDLLAEYNKERKKIKQ